MTLASIGGPLSRLATHDMITWSSPTLAVCLSVCLSLLLFNNITVITPAPACCTQPHMISQEASPTFMPRLQYDAMALSDVHVFGLANALRRPIIVYDSLINSSAGSVYLPTLNEPSVCIRSPIAVAWSNSAHDHFVSICPVNTTNPGTVSGLTVRSGELPLSLARTAAPTGQYACEDSTCVARYAGCVGSETESVTLAVATGSRRLPCLLTAACIPHTGDPLWGNVNIWGHAGSFEQNEKLLFDYLDIKDGAVELGVGNHFDLSPIIKLLKQKFLEAHNVELTTAGIFCLHRVPDLLCVPSTHCQRVSDCVGLAACCSLSVSFCLTVCLSPFCLSFCVFASSSFLIF